MRLAIIGSGIGGTALGALLSKEFEILLFEKNSLIGGRCATYEKEGFKVDVGVHLFAEGPQGPLDEVLKIIGEPSLKWELSRNPRPLLYYKGKTMVYSRQTMVDMVPKSEIENALKLFMKVFELDEKEIESIYFKDLESWVKEFTEDKTILTFISGICGQYFCIPPSLASAGEFVRCFQSVLKKRSSAYPIGGCSSIPEAYIKIIEKNGGKVKIQKKVEKIIVKDGIARGVFVDGEFVSSDIVVSNVDIKEMVKLVGEEKFPKEYVERIKNLKYAGYVFALKVALEKKITDQKLIMYIPFSLDELEKYTTEVSEGKIPEHIGGMITSPSNYDQSLAPPGKQLIFVGTGCLRHQNFKELERKSFEVLETVFPGIKESVIWYESTSPDDIDRFVGEDGNVIGIAQSYDQVGEMRPSQITPIKGLYQVGAEAGGWGVGAELAARSAIELSEIIKKEVKK